MKGFRDFLLRGNLVDLAVAVVIGTAFAALVASLVENLVMPLLALLVGKPDFSDLTFKISDTTFGYGSFLTALITFLAIAAVVYFFVVKPFSALLERFMPKQEVGETTSCPECLSDIPAAARRCAFCTAPVGGGGAAATATTPR